MFARGRPFRAFVGASFPKQLIDTRVRVPLAFEPNLGQAPAGVRWISRTPDRTFLLTGNEAVMVLKAGPRDRHGQNESRRRQDKCADGRCRQALRVRAITSSATSRANGARPFPHYSRVRYKNVYPGIDVVYYSTDRQIRIRFRPRSRRRSKAASSSLTKARIACAWTQTETSYSK